MSELWSETLCCVLGQDTFITFTVHLSTQVYKWVLANLMPDASLLLGYPPFRGEKKWSWSLQATGIRQSELHLFRSFLEYCLIQCIFVELSAEKTVL